MAPANGCDACYRELQARSCIIGLMAHNLSFYIVPLYTGYSHQVCIPGIAIEPGSKLKDGVGREIPDEELFFSPLGAAAFGA